MPTFRFIVPFAFFVIGLAIIGFWAYPAYEGIQAVNAEIVQKQDEKQKLEAELAQLRGYIEEARNVSEEDRNTVEKALPDSPDVPTLLLDIEALAKRNGLILSSFSIGVVAAPGRPGSGKTPERGNVSITLALRGSYLAFKNYLTDITKNLRVMNIQSIGFGLSEQSTADSLEYQVVLLTYFVSNP